MPDFELWLEFEVWRAAGDSDDPQNDFFNMQISLADGRKYALNVWTYGAFSGLVAEAKNETDALGGRYMLPPDLFVEAMDRPLLDGHVYHDRALGWLRLRSRSLGFEFDEQRRVHFRSDHLDRNSRPHPSPMPAARTSLNLFRPTWKVGLGDANCDGQLIAAGLTDRR